MVKTEIMADTKITRLRNLMTPVVSYFDLLKESEELDEPSKIHQKYIDREKEKVYEIMDEIITILKEIPDDAIPVLEFQKDYFLGNPTKGPTKIDTL